MNELHALHINESTLFQIEINVVPDGPPSEPPSSLISGMESSDANQQTHHSRLGKRKVPFALLKSVSGQIITDTQAGMSRRRPSYGTPLAGATGVATPPSVIKVDIKFKCVN